MSPDLVHVPGVSTLDDDAATLFENAIRQANGIDVQILGIGSNGHIGFNEPGPLFSSRTRVVSLAKSTRASNARFFASPEDVPRQAITQGLATLFEARQCGLPRGFRTAELVVSSTLPRPAGDNRSGLRWGVGSRARSAGVDCCKTLRCIG